VLRSKLDRIRALRAAVTADPLDVDKRWLLAEAFPLDNPHDEPEAGRWIRLAIAELQRILEIQQRTPGVSGLDVRRTRDRIAGHRQHLGELSPAEFDADREDEAAACEAELGPIHPRTLEALERVKHCRPLSERPHLAERILKGWEQALADHLHRLGPDHPETPARSGPEAARRFRGRDSSANWRESSPTANVFFGPDDAWTLHLQAGLVFRLPIHRRGT
jgi:hypothetical protein